MADWAGLFQANQDWLQARSENFESRMRNAHGTTEAFIAEALRIEKQQCGIIRIIINEIRKYLKEQGRTEESLFKGRTIESYIAEVERLNDIRYEKDPTYLEPLPIEEGLRDDFANGFAEYKKKSKIR